MNGGAEAAWGMDYTPTFCVAAEAMADVRAPLQLFPGIARTALEQWWTTF